MKTTFELPDILFRKAKAGASMRGMSLRQFFTDAIAEKIRGARPGNGQRPWMRHFGALKNIPANWIGWTKSSSGSLKPCAFLTGGKKCGWIAALARQHNLPILTRDAHFDQVQGLKRFSW